MPNPSNTKLIRLEIAKTGTFGAQGSVITAEDLKEVVETFDGKCPVSLGHYMTKQDWWPQWGNVENITLEEKENGDAVLIGDISVNEVLYEAMKEGFYPSWSVSIPQRAADGKRYLHEVSMSGTDGYFKATRHMELEPGSKLANATEFAVNELTASYMYFVYNNQVYVYNLTNYTEEDTPLTLEGIPSDETITYLSYQWQNFNGDADYNFTHLVVGTQKGDAYRLYMYDLEIGRPSKLVRKIEGNGNMKMCTYTTSVDFNYNRGDQSSLPN